ncbi:MAG TPA: DUF3387 domain-containing protein [Ottowia sp.]|uniref:type I restriction endonuclease n=1 Tax=Ottowia sp. TaxID=1898956 RepID=UPI002C999DD7|nr:type I restriction endonuclease [Ottowia sp.]HMN21492.1 DUF3387 domain-containing protein [Ottowia sp.]
MSPHAWTEDQLVEQPAIALFAELGWQTASARDETLGADGTLGRETKGEVVLAARLRSALTRLNPGLPPEAIQTAIDELVRDRSAMSLVAANREIHGLLKDGIRVSVADAEPSSPALLPGGEGGTRHALASVSPLPLGEGQGEGLQRSGGQRIVRVKVVDWEQPAANDFLLVSQLTVVGSLYTCRPDLVAFVNGLPWVVVELKKPGVPARAAFDENLTHYRQQVPQLFWCNALLIASNGTDSRVGSLTADWERFFEWKRVAREDEQRRVSLEVMLRGTCAPDRLLDLAENFTLFSEHKAGLVKVLAQNHQVLGVNNAIASMLEARQMGHGRGGVFWQTQGSGKSFSMVFFAQKVLRKLAGNWTFVVVTDRVELDDQIARTFKAAGAVSEAESKECHAASGAHLRELLRGNHRYIFSLVHKFLPERVSSEKPSSPALLPEGEGSRHYRGGYPIAGLTERARQLRQAGTKAEELLWELVRNRQFCDLKFRRQHQVGDYIVDFYCAQAGLVVELDGEVHDDPDVAARDGRRDAWLRGQGMKVLRFSNDQVLHDTEVVLSRIAEAAHPSPSGRGAWGEGQPSRMPVLSDKQDVIVMVDEAHRSQYDTLALNMRASLPRALFLAFTGTPLIASEERTREVFGDYVSIYDFQQSVEDGATVPLFYENRTPALQLVNPDLNDDIYRLIDEAGLDDAQEDKLQQVLGRQYHLITRDERLEVVAADIVQHFLGRASLGEIAGKAMVVSIDKATALKMHDKVRKHWAAEMARVQQELGRLAYAVGGEASAEQARRDARKAELKRRLALLESTDMALVVSPAQNEIEQMRALGLDIAPHRQRMNESQPGLDEKFKDVHDPLRLVFVCAMWLTGFDAPSCATIYLDKPMRNHTLMQTIARANRVFPGKHSGVIVDYANVFASLEKALAIYGAGRGGERPVRDKAELVAALREAVAAATAFCASHGVDLTALEELPSGSLERLAAVEDAINALIAPDSLRRDFLGHERLVGTLYRAVQPDPAAIEFAARTLGLNQLAAAIRARLNPDQPDISAILGQIGGLLDESITGHAIREGEPPAIDLSRIDFEALAQRFKASRHKNTELEALKAAIRARLDQLVRLNRTRTDYTQKFEALIESYNTGSRNIEQLFEELLKLSRSLDDEAKRHVRENLSEEELVIFDILTRPAPELTAAERDEVKKVARELLARLRGLLVLNWRQKSAARSSLRLAIEETLDDGLPRAYDKPLYEQKCAQLFEHVYESYPERDAGVYAQGA